MSIPLPTSEIFGTVAPSEPGVLASLAYPLQGLLLVAAALVAVAFVMMSIRAIVTRLRIPEGHPGPVLVAAGVVPPEIVAVISAAVMEAFESGGSIVAITPVGSTNGTPGYAWSSEGRRAHFASHKVR